jgi:nitrate/TMAO reductase-like tetraheme cytochrome c subunit
LVSGAYTVRKATIALAAVALVAVVLLGAGVLYYAGNAYTSTSEFCGGSCHTMDEQFAAWKSSSHFSPKTPGAKRAECIECHFLPGEKKSFKAQMEGARHLAAYLYDPEAPLPIRPVVKDGACLRSGCHAKEAFQDKELKFTEKAVFKHKVHFEKGLGGRNVACDNCHFKVTAEKHFEVPKEICFLCHLKLEKPTLESADVEQITFGDHAVNRITFRKRPSIDFNQGASKCDICHTIPTKSLQSQISEDSDGLTKSITHQTIKEAGVACEGCHFEVVKGRGEINTGNVVANGCLNCHNRSKELLAKAADGKLMHDAHVTEPRADCFDCHGVIEHRNRTDHLDFVREDCGLCHQDQHKYQKILLAGIPVSEGISASEHLMFSVNTNCMACHLEKKLSRGHAVRTGAPETCAACHTPEHKKMLGDWKKQVDKELAFTREVETEAREKLANAEGKLDAEKIAEARKLIDAGHEFLNVVLVGNGVHNKKYSITILDEAIGSFDDAIALLESEN